MSYWEWMSQYPHKGIWQWERSKGWHRWQYGWSNKTVAFDVMYNFIKAKKPHTEAHGSCDFAYVKCPDWVNLSEGKEINGHQARGGGGIGKRYGFLSGVMERPTHHEPSWLHSLCTKTHWAVHRKWVTSVNVNSISINLLQEYFLKDVSLAPCSLLLAAKKGNTILFILLFLKLTVQVFKHKKWTTSSHAQTSKNWRTQHLHYRLLLLLPTTLA